jgi:4-amino-4-deoxy-L-arabinose transferase-like glycosyltransferase
MFSTRVALALIFLLTLGTRLAFFASDPVPHTGPWVYGAMAHNIIYDGHWFQVNHNGPSTYFTFTKPLRKNGPVLTPEDVDLKSYDAHPIWSPWVSEPVGETLLVTAVWEITGIQRWQPVALARILLDAFAALLIYRIAMRLFKRRRAALLAAAMYAAYPPIAELVINPNTDVWSVEFAIAILALWLEAINSPRPWRWFVACGLVTGFGAYFHPGVLLLPGAFALAGIAAAGWRTSVRRALVPTAIAVLMIVPWTIRNYNDFHTFIPIRGGTGETLWYGLHGEIHNPYTKVYADYTYELVHSLRPDLVWLSPEYDAFQRQLALELISRHPLFYLKLIAHRVWMSTIVATDVEWMHHGTKTPSAYPRGPVAYVIEHPFWLVQVVLMPLVFLFAMLSMIFTWRRYRNEHLLLIATALTIMVPYFILHFEPRFMVPAAIAYLLWIGLGADLLIERTSVWRASRHSRARSAGALAG